MRRGPGFINMPRPPRMRRPGDDLPAYRDVRDVFERAEAAAQEAGTDVTADHLVLGVLRAADTSGAAVLRDLGIVEADVRSEGAPRRGARARWGAPLQPIIQAASEEARQLGSRLTRSAHVLLGIVASGQGALPGLLAGRGVTLEALRTRVRAAIAAAPASTVAPVEAPSAAPGAPSRELFTVDQAADFLGIHHQTLRGYIKSGKLQAYRLAGEKVLRIKREDLMTLLEPVAVGDVDEG
ncbi:MAG TPA: helix-turn-helix domain-containing protein [Nitrospiria bacterium]|nr:helix-turn-helix domain-containing protein [Nitrospiria bacterium]